MITVTPPMTNEYYTEKQLQKIGEGSRDGNAKKYSNFARVVGMATNTTGIPTLHAHTCTLASHNTALSLVELL